MRLRTLALLAAAAFASRAGERIQISNQDGKWTVAIDNGTIRLTCGRAPDGKDKITSLVLKSGNVNIGMLDSRHTPGDPSYYILKKAEIVRDDAERSTARLDYGSRVEDLTLTAGSPILELDYRKLDDNRHTYDPAGRRGRYVASGADEWLALRKKLPPSAPGTEIAKLLDQSELFPLYEKAFYRTEWAPPNALSYRGWMVLGVARPDGSGYGLLLPAAKVRWLKLMGGSGGFERIMAGPYKAYYYPVATGGAEAILGQGKAFIDREL